VLRSFASLTMTTIGGPLSNAWIMGSGMSLS
jgi:hypothetical protein